MRDRHEATAVAHPNLALVKYWGVRDAGLNLATNNSISVNLAGLTTRTRVRFVDREGADRVELDGRPADAATLARVSALIDVVRQHTGGGMVAEVSSTNDFPAAVGLASSASGFAALALASSRAAGLDLDEPTLSALARRGSGSACRSIPDGFVEWLAGRDDASSYARSIASADHWDLAILSIVFARTPKEVPSGEGHRLAASSPLFTARLAGLPATLDCVRRAIEERDLESLLLTTEREAVNMHAIAVTSVPEERWRSGVYYWQPDTMRLIQAVQGWRRDGLMCGFTIDAGANVHLLCAGEDGKTLTDRIEELLADRDDVQVLVSRPGSGASILET